MCYAWEHGTCGCSHHVPLKSAGGDSGLSFPCQDTVYPGKEKMAGFKSGVSETPKIWCSKSCYLSFSGCVVVILMAEKGSFACGRVVALRALSNSPLFHHRPNILNLFNLPEMGLINLDKIISIFMLSIIQTCCCWAWVVPVCSTLFTTPCGALSPDNTGGA